MTKTIKLRQSKTQQEQTKGLAKTKRGLGQKREKCEAKEGQEKDERARLSTRKKDGVTEKVREEKNARERRKNEREKRREGGK